MKALKEQQLSELDSMQFDLIRGEFTSEEAMEILNNLLRKKIRFHQMKNFSCEITNGCNDQNSLLRIEELKENRDVLEELLKEAGKLNAKLRIVSNIQIELI